MLIEMDPPMAARPTLIVFDVNETLLDIDALEPLFDRIFATTGRMREWFAQLILYSETFSLTGNYVPFDKLGASVLRMLGKVHGVVITEAHVNELGKLIADLPVYSDVPASLRVLKDAGFTLITLTNSYAGPGPDPLDKTGLAALFDRRFTVDLVKRFKPAPAFYQMVTDAMKLAPADTWLVAAHAWDTIGAQSFGWKAALVTRGINAPLVLDGVPQPTVVARDLTGIVQSIIAVVGRPNPVAG